MKVMLTVLYLSIGINSVAALSMRSCLQEPRAYTIDEMERMVYAAAREKGGAAHRHTQQDTQESQVQAAGGKVEAKIHCKILPFKNLSVQGYRPQLPGLDRLPPLPGQSSQALPPPPLIRPGLRPPIHSLPPLPSGNIMTGVFTSGFAPQAPPQSQPYPQTFYIPIQNLQPPPGVTIRVETGLRDGVLPDVMVTLSPMMTIVEALKQAESKYRSYLGLTGASDEAVISFSRSSRRVLRRAQLQQRRLRRQGILEDHRQR
ncbi:uncharacterized protein CEXT_431321 [Caerostris extrusa]|uniref:Uncharacterized protein n=1 Tax=Caerostris extrusa TaxID=172846 RepID=A0AAV4TI54_CAEEX|nr:uncharacterized protein CEXT_431321 [Caerostris extrusa]